MLLELHIVFMVGHDPNSNYLIKVKTQTKMFQNKQVISIPSPL